jgi:uncharacterized protein
MAEPDSPAPAPRVEMVVVQPTPFCNINCTYCYLPQRADTTVIRQETVAKLFEELFASGFAAPHVTVIWHAGEPLVVPVQFYETAFAAIEAMRPPSVAIRHAFQTNGMLLNEAWCDFFKRWNVGVGVSIDGPQEYHDAHRVTRDGRGTFARTLQGIRLLREHDVPFHVITVLTAKSIGEPERLVEFYRAEGIGDVCFNVEESEGSHASGLFAENDVVARFRNFLERFWVLARETPGIRFVREVDSMITRIFRRGDATMVNPQVEPFGMLNVDCLGNVSSFSPELLGLKNPAYRDFIVGNVHTHSLAEMTHSEAMRAMHRDIALGVAACRRECGYFSVCAGGSPINKLTENGGFATSTTTFCRLVSQVPADLVLDAFERLSGNASPTATAHRKAQHGRRAAGARHAPAHAPHAFKGIPIRSM